MRARFMTLILLAAPLMPSPAGATSVAPLALDDLVGRSERIAYARVESQSARWTADHSAIYTEVTLRVLQPMKGPAAMTAGETITVRREGGVVDGIGMRVSGAATFAVGEEVVVFTERRGQALWTVGMAQGKMHVAEVAGQKVVLRQMAGLVFVNGVAPSEPTSRPLEELIADVATRAGSTR